MVLWGQRELREWAGEAGSAGWTCRAASGCIGCFVSLLRAVGGSCRCFVSVRLSGFGMENGWGGVDEILETIADSLFERLGYWRCGDHFW